MDAVDSGWREQAACRFLTPKQAMTLFFPKEGTGRGLEGKLFCTTCPVQEPCLGYAIEARVDLGVWGGRNRNEIVRERRLRAKLSRSEGE